MAKLCHTETACNGKGFVGHLTYQHIEQSAVEVHNSWQSCEFVFSMWITWDLEFVYCVKVLLFVPLSAQVHDTASPQTVLHSHLDSLDTAKSCVKNTCPI